MLSTRKRRALKFQETKDFYLLGKEPTGEIYSENVFRKIVKYRISCAIRIRDRKIKEKKESFKKLKNDVKRLEQLTKNNLK